LRPRVRLQRRLLMLRLRLQLLCALGVAGQLPRLLLAARL
jgi:hypothetical protein